MTIGDFSRATRLSAKTLRFYHQAGILEPVSIDPGNGYRWYDPEQIVDAQVVSQLRALEVPIETVRGILATQDVAVRNRLIAAHLKRLEAKLETTRAAVVSLRGLLEPASVAPVEHRSVEATPALVVRAVIDLADLSDWYSAAWASLDAALLDSRVGAKGPRGGIWDTALFLSERGEALLFHPVATLHDLPPLPPSVQGGTVPGGELAVLTHHGSDETMAQSYGTLGAYVAKHEIGLDGPIRETYLSLSPGRQQDLVTEIGWPVFRAAR